MGRKRIDKRGAQPDRLCVHRHGDRVTSQSSSGVHRGMPIPFHFGFGEQGVGRDCGALGYGGASTSSSAVRSLAQIAGTRGLDVVGVVWPCRSTACRSELSSAGRCSASQSDLPRAGTMIPRPLSKHGVLSGAWSPRSSSALTRRGFEWLRVLQMCLDRRRSWTSLWSSLRRRSARSS
jgi:hypothetical protein